MDDKKPTSFTFEIDNLSEKKGLISSPTFLSGNYEWFVNVYPNGYHIDERLSLHLQVANPESLPLGWKKQASYSFALLNQSGKELYRTPESCKLFRAQFTGWGSPKAFTLQKLQDMGYLENNKLILKVDVKVIEAVDEGAVTGKDMLDVRGFKVLYSQLPLVNKLFRKHPDIAVNFKLKNQSVKTTYMNLLLGLIEKLDKPSPSFTEIELSNAQSELIDLTEAGFELDWLKKKLDEISLEKKRGLTDGSRVQEIDELIKNLNLELEKEKEKSATCAAEVLLLEQTVSDLRVELRKEKKKSATSATEVLLLEQMVLDLRVELSKEKDKSATPNDLLEGVASWEVLDYADLYTNEKGEE
ncbi:MATH domain and coiled-coil domain-containing protein At2g42470 [Brassica napus]|uniref:MATH domain and coiled-coil domain-containing protein At2g42470 n=1 Tax=Brassica napus TaxID=3708 RepID=UPI002078ABD9|nr:MATH domain and coiled-coil domain-containing protein At2g42470 [Brassica napus]